MEPIIISITGAHSGCGKTSVAEALIRGIPIRWGAIKYTETELYASLTDDDERIDTEGKDTDRMKKAGAQHVQWIRSPREELKDILGIAVDRLSGVQGIIVEGNSPAEIVSPDIIIFVYGDDPDHVKPSARPLIDRANVILYNAKPSIKTTAKMYNKHSRDDASRMIDDIAQKFSPEDVHGDG